MTLPLHDPSLWPVRMTRSEVADALRSSIKTLSRRIACGRFPQPDSDRCWPRDLVQRYVAGGIKEYDKRARRVSRPALQIVGGTR